MFQRRNTAITQTWGPGNGRELCDIDLPQRPHIPRGLSNDFVPGGQAISFDSNGRNGIAFADILDEDFIGSEDPILTDYTESVVALRLEVCFTSTWLGGVCLTGRVDF